MELLVSGSYTKSHRICEDNYDKNSEKPEEICEEDDNEPESQESVGPGTGVA